MLKRKIPAQIGWLDDRQTYQPVLSNRRYDAALAGQFLERLAGWLVSVALVILAYRLSENIAVVAAIILALIAPRLIVQAIPSLPSWRDPCRAATVLALARVPLVAGLLLVTARQDLLWAVLLVGAIGTLNALADATHCVALPLTTPRRDLSAISLVLGRAEQFAMVVGGISVAVLVAAWSERTAFALAIAALLGAAALITWGRRGSDAVLTPRNNSGQTAGTSVLSDVKLLVAGLFAGAVIGMGLRVMLVEIIVGQLDFSEALYALMIGVVGFGALLGPPISIPRLLIRIPGEALTIAGVIALAVATAFIGVVGSAILIALALVACGTIAVTNDLIVTTLARRIVPVGQVEGTFTALGATIIAGQIVALMAIAGLSQLWEADIVLISMSALCVAVVAAFWAGSRLDRARQPLHPPATSKDAA